jgi:hypothetical protein
MRPCAFFPFCFPLFLRCHSAPLILPPTISPQIQSILLACPMKKIPLLADVSAPHARQRINPEDAAPAPALNGIVTMCIYFSLFFSFSPTFFFFNYTHTPLLSSSLPRHVK